ncbi:galactose-3-O-sulfotransferase 2-like [Amphiura filiformis]|uniref:galactose-3-O-sulfotransferase 2-like n=1 Tax=Amphiura filiformis TaxID=82378 RepID=UPI003B212D90
MAVVISLPKIRWLRLSFIFTGALTFYMVYTAVVWGKGRIDSYMLTWNGVKGADFLTPSTNHRHIQQQLAENVKTCSPRNQIVFIKTHKTASTTLQTIINRFGFFYNLSFVFNKNYINNGHFYFIPLTPRNQKRLFLPPLNVRLGDYSNYSNNFDIMAVHVRYNRVEMEKFMKKHTKYISIIRDPVAQWESAFDFFKFQDAFGSALSRIPEDKWIETFLDNSSFHLESLKHLWYENVLGLRWYYAQNSQIYDLGLDSTSFHDDVVINGTVKRLEQEFDLILLAEYFDESLLILKKQFCWKYEDILYFPKNKRLTRRQLSDHVQMKIRNLNRADWLLYSHFNRTLWEKVKSYGPKFDEDLNYFRHLNHRIFHECGNGNATRFYKRVEYTPRRNSSLFCQTIAEDKQSLFRRVFNRQNPMKIYHVYK